ncbi:MAG: hypothetical protein KGY67_00515 [Candidatus Thermoplasmatota archaeon]|nr:hypothetical protein [Candidatus Thermoplasmatota archaeon]
MDELFVCSETKNMFLCKPKNKKLIEFTEGYYDEQSTFWLCDNEITVDDVNKAIKQKGDIDLFDNQLGILGCKQIEFMEDNSISKNDLRY